MENVEVRNPKKIKGNNLRVDLAFKTTELGTIVLKGFRVGPSLKYKGYWVQPPSQVVYGHYMEILFLEEKEIWHDVEKLLIEFYKKDVEYQESQMSEYVSPEEIPL